MTPTDYDLKELKEHAESHLVGYGIESRLCEAFLFLIAKIEKLEAQASDDAVAAAAWDAAIAIAEGCTLDGTRDEHFRIVETLKAARDKAIPPRCVHCGTVVGGFRRDCHICGRPLCDTACEEWHTEYYGCAPVAPEEK